MITQTLAIAEIEKWLWIRVCFFTNFWLRLRNKNTESRRSWLRHSGWPPLLGHGLDIAALSSVFLMRQKRHYQQTIMYQIQH